MLLYVTAPVLGGLVGFAERRGWVDLVLGCVGIHLRAHGDLWGRLLRAKVDVYVHLTDGSILFGWPEHYSSDRSQPGPELYLTQVQVWNPDDSKWVELEHTKGVLLDASQVSRIEFLEPPTDNQNVEVVQ